MGEALISGLLAQGWCTPPELLVVEPVADRRDLFTRSHPGIAVAEHYDPSVHRAAGALLAVKPAMIGAVAALVAPTVDRVLSIAAGVRTTTIEAAIAGAEAGRRVAVVRSMPNTPALVGLGASAIAPGSSAADEDLAWAEGILGSVGLVERVDEKLLDAVTGVSGSGPAYVFLVAEAMIEGGVAVGLPRSVATALASQTIAGAGRMLLDSGDEPATLRGNVTSPGGTTAAGLRALEQHGVRSAFIEAVAAATARSIELG